MAWPGSGPPTQAPASATLSRGRAGRPVGWCISAWVICAFGPSESPNSFRIAKSLHTTRARFSLYQRHTEYWWRSSSLCFSALSRTNAATYGAPSASPAQRVVHAASARTQPALRKGRQTAALDLTMRHPEPNEQQSLTRQRWSPAWRPASWPSLLPCREQRPRRDNHGTHPATNRCSGFPSRVNQALHMHLAGRS